jgi:hypothetical protein
MPVNAHFPKTESLLQYIQTIDGKNFKVMTSEYWLSQEDLIADEFEGDYEERQEDG